MRVDGRIGPDFAAGCSQRAFERGRDRAWPAARDPRPRRRHGLVGGAQHQQQPAARRPRSEVRAENAVGCDGRAQSLGLERFGDEIGDRHRAPAQQPIGVRLSSSDRNARSVRRSAHRSRPPGSSIGGGDEVKSVPITRPIAASDETNPGQASASRADHACSPFGRSPPLVVDDQRPIVVADGGHAVASLATNSRPCVASRRSSMTSRRSGPAVCASSGTRKPRRDLGGLGAAADRWLPFEDERLPSSLGQIGRAGEPVDSRANHDCVVRLIRHQTFANAPARPALPALPALPCLEIRIAALRPGAPMMPPPGCVADPHMYRRSMGVAYCAQPGTGRRKNSCSSVSSPWKMLPSVSPKSRSMSSGVNTCRWRMMLLMLGAYSAMVSMTVSPNASRCSSHVPSRR